MDQLKACTLYIQQKIKDADIVRKRKILYINDSLAMHLCNRKFIAFRTSRSY